MACPVAERVLILEDDAGVARLQRLRLERAGYQVECAETAEQARKLLQQESFDLMLLDYRVSDASDGLAFYRELKESGRDIPVIMVTGFTDEKLIITALRHGLRDYVTKSSAYLDYLPEAVERVMLQERNARQRRLAEDALRETNLRLEETLTELRSTSQQLWQAAKLATVGELVASIAHELNNPLGTISLRLESILDRTPKGHENRSALDVIDAEVDRMARLISNLLQFSRQTEEQFGPVDVGEEAQMSAELASHHFRRRGVEKVFELDPTAPPIVADRQKLRQVFLNLYTNAADAMPLGGRLITRLYPASECKLVIEVQDTGVGIPAEQLPRVTEPFFTTKGEGQGTGLGLAICRRIIHDHKGDFTIQSRLGQGTTVRISLPVLGPQGQTPGHGTVGST